MNSPLSRVRIFYRCLDLQNLEPWQVTARLKGERFPYMAMAAEEAVNYGEYCVQLDVDFLDVIWWAGNLYFSNNDHMVLFKLAARSD